MSTPTAPRAWLAGLLDLTANLTEVTAYLIAHLGEGLEALAHHVAPPHECGGNGTRVVQVGDHMHAIPHPDTIEHDISDDCLCGPSVKCQQSDEGDVWLIKHHRLAPTDQASADTEETR